MTSPAGGAKLEVVERQLQVMPDTGCGTPFRLNLITAQLF